MNNILPKASVIIPVYNQFQQLLYVLAYLNVQSCPYDRFEVLVINDGSTDGFDTSYIRETIQPKYHLNVIEQENQGRSSARNAGIRQAQGEIIIFCDSDRLPDRDFVLKHISQHENASDKDIAVIGACYDYFGSPVLLDQQQSEIIKRFSRLPQYFKRVSHLYNEDNTTDSPIAWITFLVGNTSLKKKALFRAGLFNESFKSWGFEHFELALRLMDQGIIFRLDSNTMNYHLPHKREKSYILEQYQLSCKLLETLHPSKPVGLLLEFLTGKISLQHFEKAYCGQIPGMEDNGIFFRQFSL